MSLKPISPRLRVVNNTADVARLDLRVAPGDVLDVPADIGEQILGARAGFREEGVIPTPPVPVTGNPDEPDVVEAVPVKAKPKSRRKRTTR